LDTPAPSLALSPGAQYGIASIALSLEENPVMDYERAIQLVWPVVRPLVENGHNRGTVLM
jgi:broad specificity polyphosphatase/5'/3'-nucleotidase SurE